MIIQNIFLFQTDDLRTLVHGQSQHAATRSDLHDQSTVEPVQGLQSIRFLFDMNSHTQVYRIL